MKKNPIHHLLDMLPEDMSKIIITKEFCDKVLDLLKRSELNPHNTHRVVDDFLLYLHQQNVITLSYTQVGSDRINFIQRKISGYKTREV